jgi:hypothetical protein
MIQNPGSESNYFPLEGLSPPGRWTGCAERFQHASSYELGRERLSIVLPAISRKPYTAAVDEVVHVLICGRKHFISSLNPSFVSLIIDPL